MGSLRCKYCLVLKAKSPLICLSWSRFSLASHDRIIRYLFSPVPNWFGALSSHPFLKECNVLGFSIALLQVNKMFDEGSEEEVENLRDASPSEDVTALPK
jgi:hypothetical protein